MNKKIFNIKQFFQTFQQLKTIGIIATMLLLLGMLSIPISTVLNIQRNIEIYGENMATLPYVIDIVSQSVFLYFTFILYTPIMALMTWNYMTKRNASDFYQSLPYTRVCTFFTHGAAVIAWQLLTLVVVGVATAITYGAFSNYFIIDYGVFVHMLLNVFACNLLCFAAITLACSLTGSIFSNVCVSGLIIFLPRLMVHIISVQAVLIVPVLSAEHLFSLLGAGYNMLTESVFMMVGISNLTSLNSLCTSNHGLIYTMLLAILYLILALFIFNTRKSETAGNGANGKLVQILIRVVIGFVISYICILNVFGDYRRSAIDENDVMLLVLSFAASVALVMVYEGINTKTVRGAVRSIPSGILAVIISILLGLGTYAMIVQAEAYAPSESEVSSVVMSKDNYTYYSEYEDYFADYVSGLAIKNDKIEKILCDALRENVEEIRNSGTELQYNYFNKRTAYTVGFHEGVMTTYRVIYLTDSQISQITEELKNVESYRNAMLDLPEVQDASISIYHTNDIWTAERKEAIYQMILQESKEIDFSDWFQLVAGYGDQDGFVRIVFNKEGNVYAASIPLSRKMPKTYELYMQTINEIGYGSDFIDKLVEQLTRYGEGKEDVEDNTKDNMEEADNTYCGLTVYNEQIGDPEYFNIGDNSLSSDIREDLLKYADAIKNNHGTYEIDCTKPYVKIEYSFSSGDQYESVVLFVQIAE